MSVFISGLIVAHNEEQKIEDALKSLNFCDEIVVVLDNCTDGTEGICKKFTGQILKGSWPIEGERRAVGIEACKGKWIVELDADERVSDPLKRELQHTLKDAPDGYFQTPIDNYVGGRLVKHGWAGSFGTTRTKKVFSKGSKVWGMDRVHPKLELKGQEMELFNPIVHLVDDDIDDMIDRLQRYSTAMAKDMRDRHEPAPHPLKTFRKMLTRFYKSYLGRKGYKEGRMGFFLAIVTAMMPLMVHVKRAYEYTDDASKKS